MRWCSLCPRGKNCHVLSCLFSVCFCYRDFFLWTTRTQEIAADEHLSACSFFYYSFLKIKNIWKKRLLSAISFSSIIAHSAPLNFEHFPHFSLLACRGLLSPQSKYCLFLCNIKISKSYFSPVGRLFSLLSYKGSYLDVLLGKKVSWQNPAPSLQGC